MANRFAYMVFQYLLSRKSSKVTTCREIKADNIFDMGFWTCRIFNLNRLILNNKEVLQNWKLHWAFKFSYDSVFSEII